MHLSIASRPVGGYGVSRPLHLRDPDRCAISCTYWAVTLLLAALEVGQNIDRLARFTGCKRSFVARCARRLVDNGVWRDGRTICAWGEMREQHPTFWKDVAVAEGKLCRRTNDAGRFEWAAPGAWPRIPVAAYAEEEMAFAPRSMVPLPTPRVGERRRRAADAESPLADESLPEPTLTQPPMPRDRLSVLFPDAVWLG